MCNFTPHSKTFTKWLVKDIGLYEAGSDLFPPDFSAGIIMAVLALSGTIPVFIDIVHSIDKGFEIFSLHFFNNMAGIPSGPLEALSDSLLIAYLIISSLIWIF